MLSRLWYLVLALAVGGALAGAFLNKSAASREVEFQLEEQLRRDRVEAELWQRLDARLRLDALASIAVEPEVRQVLRSSSGRLGTPTGSTRRRLSQKLNVLNRKLEEGKGDMVFAVDTEGEVVATLDKNATEAEQLDKMPLVRDALRGFMRDDVWVYNGKVYRMAARPVIDGGRYVGVVVHGMEVGDELAKRLGNKLPNASIAFYFRDRLIGVHVGGVDAPTIGELKGSLSAAAARAEGTDGSVEVGERVRVIASPVRGDAAHAQVGYVIGRRGSTVGLGGLFANTFKEDVASLPWLIVVGGPLLLLVLGLLLLYMEHDKGVVILRKSAESLAKNELKSLPEGELRRHYRKIAEHLNVALRAGVGVEEDAERRASVDLDQILSSTRDSSDSGYFGFAEAPTHKMEAPKEQTAPKPVGASQQMAPIESPPVRLASSRPKRQSSWPNRAPSSHRPAAAVRQIDDEEEESTQIKHVPQELINASMPNIDQEEIHFRDVFQQFVATQKECGAEVSGLTFEKFERKLHAARDQVMKRHNVAAVRFTVYVKEGRAALKANPVKQ